MSSILVIVDLGPLSKLIPPDHIPKLGLWDKKIILSIDLIRSWSPRGIRDGIN